jgi:hypothetical protein
MTIKYPSSIDTTLELPYVINNATPISAAIINNLRDAVVAMETELGVKPSGIYANVRSRIAALEITIGNFQIISLENDLGGTLAQPKVVGLQGIEISAATPTLNQGLVFNGLAWAPANLAAGALAFTATGDLSGTELLQTVVGLQGRPLAATLPIDGYAIVWDNAGTTWKPGIVTSFTAGNDLSGTSSSQTVIGLQSNPVSAASPGSGDALIWSGTDWAPGASFVPGGDLSGTVTSQTVEKINGATVPVAGALTTGHVLKVSGASATSYGLITNANIDLAAALDVSKFSGGTNGYVLSTVAGATTWVVQVPREYEIYFASGVQTTTSTSFVRAGARTLDMTPYPATIGALTRTVKFVADVDKTSGATSVEVQLYDTANTVIVTGTTLTSMSNANAAVTATLTVGASPGNLQTASSQYELQLKMNGGGGSDAVSITNARLLITYA